LLYGHKFPELQGSKLALFDRRAGHIPGAGGADSEGIAI
jgi:hypothetical protein